MNPLFEPADGVENVNGIRVISIERANEKCASLGIDAETPGKLKRLERYEQVVSYKTVENVLSKDLARLAELEKMIADAPLVYGYKSRQPAPVDTHRARLIAIEEIK